MTKQRADEGEGSTRNGVEKWALPTRLEIGIERALIDSSVGDGEWRILSEQAPLLDLPRLQGILARAFSSLWASHASECVRAMHEHGAPDARVSEVEAIARAATLHWDPALPVPADPLACPSHGLAARVGELAALVRVREHLAAARQLQELGSAVGGTTDTARFGHPQSARVDGGEPAADGSSRGAMPKHLWRAAVSLAFVSARAPHLTDHWARYDWLRDHGCEDAYGDTEMPDKETWVCYTRKARARLNGVQRNSADIRSA